MPGNSGLDARHCKIYLFGCWTFLYSYIIELCSGIQLSHLKQFDLFGLSFKVLS